MLANIISPRADTYRAHVTMLSRIRWIAIFGQILLIVFARVYLKIQLPLINLFTLISLECLLQIYCLWRLHRRQNMPPVELLLQLLFDSFILAALVYFSGGANNPFIYLLLFPIALGTLMLKPGELLLIAITQLALYSLLHLYRIPLLFDDTSPLSSYHLHLAGMWANFVLTVVLVSVFGLLARQSILQQEKKIQQLHEQQQQDELLLGLGIMSASAAHELGTPLSTMAVIIDDLQHNEQTAHFTDEINILAEQIEVSRQIIQSLSERGLSGVKPTEKPIDTLPFKLRLSKTFEHWLVYRPQIQLRQQWQAELEQLVMPLTTSLEQAIVNLLDNAADASLANGSDQVEVVCSLQAETIFIEIHDNGSGITPEIQQSAGVTPLKTEKQQGLGWGLFLSNASIQRAGGRVRLSNRETGGTLTQISLPLSSLGETA